MRAAVIGANSYIARNMIRVNQFSHYADTALYDVQPAHLDGIAGYRQLDPSSQTELERGKREPFRGLMTRKPLWT